MFFDKTIEKTISFLDEIYEDEDNNMIQTGRTSVRSDEYGDFYRIDFHREFATDDVVVLPMIQTHNGNSYAKLRVCHSIFISFVSVPKNLENITEYHRD